MARINTYITDTTVNGADKWIGTDSVTGKTRNFTARDIAEYVSGAVTYVFEQITPASTWVINHNIGKFPSITVVDSSNNVVVGFSTYNSDKVVTVQFSAPFAGKAYLN